MRNSKKEWDANKNGLQDGYEDFGWFLSMALSEDQYIVPKYLTFFDFGLSAGRQLKPIEVLSWFMSRNRAFKKLNFPFDKPSAKICGALTSFYDESLEDDLNQKIKSLR